MYKISIKDIQLQREAVYIGVTSRTVHRRIEEHKKDIRQAKTSTSLAQEVFTKDRDSMGQNENN